MITESERLAPAISPSQAPKGRFIWNSSVFSAALVLGGILTVLRSYFMARFLGPAGFGTWKFLQIFEGYLPFASAGSQEALTRRVPYLRARGEFREAQLALQTASGLNLAGGALFCAVLLGFSLFVGAAFERRALALFAPVLLLLGWLRYTKAYTLVTERYPLRSRIELVHAVSAASLAVPLVYFWGIYGAIVGFAVSAVLTIHFGIARIPERFGFRIEWTTLRGLVLTGFPITLNGILLTTMGSADRIVLAVMSSREILGIYTVASAAVSILKLVPASFGQMLFVKFAEIDGERRPPERVSQILQETTVVLSGLFAPVLCFSIAAFPAVVAVLLPEFVRGIPAGKILIAELFFLGTSLPATNWCVSTGRVKPIIGLRSVLVIAEFAAIYSMVRFGFPIEAVAASVLVVSALFTLSVTVLSKQMLGERLFGALAHALTALVPFTAVLITLVAQNFFHPASDYVPGSGLYLSSLLSFSLGLVFCVPFVSRILKKQAIRDVLGRLASHGVRAVTGLSGRRSN